MTDAEVTLHVRALDNLQLVLIAIDLTHIWVCLLISSTLIRWTFLLPASSHVITHESRVRHFLGEGGTVTTMRVERPLAVLRREVV